MFWVMWTLMLISCISVLSSLLNFTQERSLDSLLLANWLLYSHMGWSTFGYRCLKANFVQRHRVCTFCGCSASMHSASVSRKLALEWITSHKFTTNV